MVTGCPAKAPSWFAAGVVDSTLSGVVSLASPVVNDAVIVGADASAIVTV